MSILIAHRGASAHAQENTLESFQLAFAQGADGIEGDFLLSKDRQLICFHDLNGKRLLQRSKPIKDMTYREIQKAATYHIPTLDEVLNILPQGKKLYIELKCGRKVEQELIQSLSTSSVSSDQIKVISFRLPTLIRLREISQKIHISWIRKLKHKDKSRSVLTQIKKTLIQHQFNGFSLNQQSFSKEIRSYFKGFHLNTWTVDDPKRFSELIKWQCDSISSNDPQGIRKNCHEF